MEIPKIKFLKREKKFRKGDSWIKPDLYFRLVVLVVLFLVAVFMAFGWYFFRETSMEQSASVENVSFPENLDEKKIRGVLDYFEARKEKSKEILNSPSPVIDPSL